MEGTTFSSGTGVKSGEAASRSYVLFGLPSIPKLNTPAHLPQRLTVLYDPHNSLSFHGRTSRFGGNSSERVPALVPITQLIYLLSYLSLHFDLGNWFLCRNKYKVSLWVGSGGTVSHGTTIETRVHCLDQSYIKIIYGLIFLCNKKAHVRLLSGP